MENEYKKNNNILYAVIVVLVAIICLLFGFIIGKGNLFDKDTNEPNVENKEESKVTNLSIESSLVQDLYNKVSVYKGNHWSEYNNYFYKRDKLNLSEENITFKLSLSAESIKNTFKTDKKGYDCNNGICGISYIDENTIKNAYYNLFGKDSNYSRTTFNIGGCSKEYKWSDQNNRYEAIIPEGCGDATTLGTQAKLTSAKKIVENNKEKIIIVEAVAFIQSYGDNAGYYKDANYTEYVESYSDQKEVLENNIDSYSKYKYTFEKDSNGTYVFTTVEKVK